VAVTVKKVSIWRTEVEDRPGTLARVLEPLAGAGADLKVVMGYRYPGEGSRAAIEVYPVSGKKLTAAAQSAGLSPVSIPTLLVEGDDRPGLGQKLSAALGEGASTSATWWPRWWAGSSRPSTASRPAPTRPGPRR